MIREILPLDKPYHCECGETANSVLIERTGNNNDVICRECDERTPVRVYTPTKGKDLTFRIEQV